MMKTDELRRALDDLAGDVPPVDDALRRVTGRARRERTRSRVGIVAVCAVVVAAATVGTVHLRSSSKHISVVGPTPAGLDDLTWTRVSAPFSVSRVVTIDGRAFAVGTGPTDLTPEPDREGDIDTLDANDNFTNVFRDVAASAGIAGVSDIVAVPGALVAVGISAIPPSNGFWGGAAWRSTDDGRTWSRVTVDQPPEPEDASLFPSGLGHLVVANGVIYAFGQSRPNGQQVCPDSVWTSVDGTHFALDLQGPACTDFGAATNGPNGVLATALTGATAWLLDGSTWTSHVVSSEPDAQVLGVSGDSDGYVAVGSTGTPNDSTGAIWSSPDGITWTRVATDTPPADPTRRQAHFTGVTHTDSGWIAVGSQLHPGGNPAVTDAILWTSPDGQQWTENTRDAGTFDQFANAQTVGATANGFAVSGVDNITGTGVPDSGDPIRQDQVLWLGTSAASTSPAGIVEGTMDEAGGLAPGIDKGIQGSLTATAADGRTATIPVTADGTFSAQLTPGTYTIVGQSPLYNDGDGTCGARYLGGDELGDTFIVRAGKLIHVEVVCAIR